LANSVRLHLPVNKWLAGINGKERNKHASKRQKSGRGPVGKQPVLGMRQRDTGEVRAWPVPAIDGKTLKATVRQNVH